MWWVWHGGTGTRPHPAARVDPNVRTHTRGAAGPRRAVTGGDRQGQASHSLTILSHRPRRSLVDRRRLGRHGHHLLRGAVACTNGHTLAKLRALRTRRYTTLRYQRSQLAAQPRRPRRTLAPARPARAQPAAPSAPVRYGYYATPDATTHTTLRYATLLYRRLRRCCSAPARRARPQPLQLEAARRRRRRRLRRILVRPPRRARVVAFALSLPLSERRHAAAVKKAPWLASSTRGAQQHRGEAHSHCLLNSVSIFPLLQASRVACR